MQEKNYNIDMKKTILLILLAFLATSPVFAESETKLKSSISDIQKDIDQANAEINFFDDQLKELDSSLKHIHTELGSLNHRLGEIFHEINDSNQRLETYTSQAEIIKEKQEQLEKLITALDEQKQKFVLELQLILTQLYLEAENAGVFDNEDLRFLKLVLNEQTANEILQDLDNLSYLEQILVSSISKLEKNLKDLEKKDLELKDSLEKNIALQQEILNEKQQLAGFVEAQNNLIQIQKDKQITLQDLINRSKSQQQQAMDELRNLATQKSDIERKLTQLRLERKQKQNKTATKKDVNLSTSFIWPASPSRGISAHFRDPDYFRLFGIPHNAVDVPLVMQTPLKSPEDGVVIKVKGGSGLDYHYVIIEHPGGIRTLFGHLYKIFVSPGDVVSKGQVFALSGGMPGTTGAGFLTTGPHLHLEFSKDGQYVNPLNYLP